MRCFRCTVGLLALALALPLAAQEPEGRIRPVLRQPGAEPTAAPPAPLPKAQPKQPAPTTQPAAPGAKPPKAEIETLPPQRETAPEEEGSPIVKCPEPELVRQAISTLKTRITTVKPPAGTLPKDCDESHPFAEPIHVGMGGDRGWSPSQYDWTPPGLAHRPLYFEDDPLERYGQSRLPGVQPVASYIRFYAQMAAIPYRAALEEPRRTICTLGYERPGVCVRPTRQLPPWSRRAALVEGATIAGLILLIP